MLYWLIKANLTWLESRGLGFLRVFTFVEFQTVAAILLSFAIVIAAGPGVIRWLRRKKIGDRPDFDQADINAQMAHKKDTPTMGGVLIIAAIAVTALLLSNWWVPGLGRFGVDGNFHVTMALVCLLGFGIVGAIDDWLKLTAARRGGGRQGLHSGEKLLFQFGLAIVLSYFTWRYGQHVPQRNFLYLPFLKDAVIPLGALAFVLIGTVVIVGFSNAVNLTDGLDGLASGCTAIVSIAFLILALVVGTRALADALLFTYIKGSDQMAVLCGAMLGACLGFLWYNCNPARVFMGDTGSLSLGAFLAYVAIVLRQEPLLILVGAVFVAEAGSSFLQVMYFKYTRRRYGTGQRIFLMAPLHHHFQKKGWSEVQVVVRFWLISAMLAAVALATIKLR
ncbi:MAG TPA: phospho-N-acetylmuramoyl-pentapeptide-transferase [Tepidisphaeraceae bacterium]|nr:phospho-N-acetylmuramoyl-pentapeptide-transferase [Tepidisphaeraceae bacterium]